MYGIFTWISENPDITQKQKNILYITFGILPAGLLCAVISSLLFPQTKAERIADFLKDQSKVVFSGKVDSVFFDVKNHNMKRAVLSDKTKFEVFDEWGDKIAAGDSVVKTKGSVIIKIYRDNKYLSSADYREVAKNW